MSSRSPPPPSDPCTAKGRPCSHDSECRGTRLAGRRMNGGLSRQNAAERNRQELRARPHGRCGAVGTLTAATHLAFGAVRIPHACDASSVDASVAGGAVAIDGAAGGTNATTRLARVPRIAVILRSALLTPSADAVGVRAAVGIAFAGTHRDALTVQTPFGNRTRCVAGARNANAIQTDMTLTLERRCAGLTVAKRATIRAGIRIGAVRVIATFRRRHDAVAARGTHACDANPAGRALRVGLTRAADAVDAESVSALERRRAGMTARPQTEIRAAVGIIAVSVITRFRRGHDRIPAGLAESLDENDARRPPLISRSSCSSCRTRAPRIRTGAAAHRIAVTVRHTLIRSGSEDGNTQPITALGMEGSALSGCLAFVGAAPRNLHTLIAPAGGM